MVICLSPNQVQAMRERKAVDTICYFGVRIE